MKRISLAAALGAAVLLAGCSSTSGTATANSSSTSSSAASSAAPVVSSAPAVASGAPESSAPSSAPESDSPTSSDATESSAPESGGGVTSSGDESSSSQSASTTVGDGNTSLDGASAAWFSAFCTGFSPVVSLAQSAGTSIAGQASDPTKAQAAIVSLYSSFGSAFTDTAAKLKDLPPPTFDGGPAFATKVVAALDKAGPVFTANATKLKAVDVSKDPTAFTSALSSLSTDMTTALAPLQDLGSLKLTPQTQAAFEALPACAKLKAVSGG